MTHFIIKLCENTNRLGESSPIYKAVWQGDPGRTYDIESATKYCMPKYAKSVLTKIRNLYGRPFKDAEILKVEDE